MSRIILSSTSENSFVKVHFISTIFCVSAISLSSTFLNSVTIVKKTTTILTPLAWPMQRQKRAKWCLQSWLHCFLFFPSGEMDYNISKEFRTTAKKSWLILPNQSPSLIHSFTEKNLAAVKIKCNFKGKYIFYLRMKYTYISFVRVVFEEISKFSNTTRIYKSIFSKLQKSKFEYI